MFILLLSVLKKHNSSLVCMVGITYVNIDTVFGFYGGGVVLFCFVLFCFVLFCFACLFVWGLFVLFCFVLVWFFFFFFFWGGVLFFTHLYCLVGCLSMNVWTHAVLGVIYARVLYVCICTRSAKFSMFHMERRSRNTLIDIEIPIQYVLVPRALNLDG